MTSLFAQSELYDLILKVEQGERLEFDAGLRMMKSQDILALGYMANLVRERKNGNQTYFMINRDRVLTNEETHLVDGLNPEERIDQLIQLRTLQDRTGEFLTFVPIPFDPSTANLEGTAGVRNTTGFEDLKILSISRILLDNVNHIRAFWMTLGPKLTQVSLAFGVDDLGGTVVEELTDHSTEAETNQVMSKRALIHMIQKAGRVAVERDTL